MNSRKLILSGIINIINLIRRLKIVKKKILFYIYLSKFKKIIFLYSSQIYTEIV
jgi:hypothetical protein